METLVHIQIYCNHLYFMLRSRLLLQRRIRPIYPERDLVFKTLRKVSCFSDSPKNFFIHCAFRPACSGRPLCVTISTARSFFLNSFSSSLFFDSIRHCDPNIRLLSPVLIFFLKGFPLLCQQDTSSDSEMHIYAGLFRILSISYVINNINFSTCT